MQAAALEPVHGDLGHAMALFATAVDSFHRAGSLHVLAWVLACLAVVFDRLDRTDCAAPDVAATLCGASTNRNRSSISLVVNLPGAVEHLCTMVGDVPFDASVATGAAMDTSDAVAYARRQIHLARRQLEGTT